MAQDWLDPGINCKRVCKIVKNFKNARFSYVLALEKKSGSG